MSAMIDAALALAARGFAVFPCRPRAKEPATPHAYKDATRDADQIHDLWNRYPDANVAIACDASGVVVLDVDPRNNGSATMQILIVKYGPLPETVTASTGGGGWHLPFRAPSGVEFMGKLGDGVDIKHHGYIVAPPSIHPSGQLYRWLEGSSPFDHAIAELPPTWLEAMRKPALPAQTSAVTSGTLAVASNTAYGQAAVDAQLEVVRTAPSGQRNNTLNASSCKLAGLHAGGEVADVRALLVAAAIDVGLAETEARKTVGSGWKKGLQQPRSAPASPVVDIGDFVRTADPNRQQQKAAAPLIQGEDTVCLADVQPHKTVWLWRGRLAVGEMAVFTGAPGGGKGLTLCYVVACYTTGRPMHGDSKALPANHVVWIAIEDAHDTALVPRLQAAGADHARVHAWKMERPISLPDDTARIVSAIEQYSAGLLIIDPAPTLLDREHSSNNDADVRRSFAPLMAACRTHNCALILVRHTNKRTLGSAMDRGGGSIAWSGMARVELMLGRLPSAEGAETDESLITLATVKNNLSKWAPALDMRIVEVGESARIEVVGETDATADDLCAQERPRAATKANEAASMLRELLKDGQWHPYTEIAQAANQGQISSRTLKRAKQAMGVDSKQFATGWFWRLAGQGDSPGTAPDTVALWPPGLQAK